MPIQIQTIDPSIFRAYDIRGEVDTQLTLDAVYTIALAIGSQMHEMGKKNIVIGRDGRLSSPALIQALRQGLIDSGRDIVDIGIVPSPVLYFASHFLNIDCAIILTGSHNPSQYNGLKMILNGVTLADAQIQALYQRILRQDFYKAIGTGTFREDLTISEQYIHYITQQIQLPRRLKVVIDCGNGAAGEIAPILFSQLNADVIPLYCEIDGRFPNHHPDPSVEANLVDLITAVKTHQADVGLAFDGDADRLGVVTSTGHVIWPDRLMMLFSKDILQRHPQGKIVFDVKCSMHLPTVISNAGGIPLMCPTGHSLVKAKMKSVNALLAGELSGHIFFKENWFGFDDGLYSACRLLAILAKQSLSLDALFEDIPNSVNTPEIKIPLSDEHKFDFIEHLKKNGSFVDAKMIDIDGIRIEFSDGWGLLRASNTTPCLVARFEADTLTALERIQALFKCQLNLVNTSYHTPQILNIPF